MAEGDLTGFDEKHWHLVGPPIMFPDVAKVRMQEVVVIRAGKGATDLSFPAKGMHCRVFMVVALCAGLLLAIPHLASADVQKAPASNTAQPSAHGKGYIPDPVRYKKIEKVQRYRAFLPPKYDLAADLPPPGNQGDQGSCVAWAVGYAARTYYLKHYYSLDVTKKENQVSPAYIFNSLAGDHGDCDKGTSPIDALELLKSSGGVPISVLPYNPHQCLTLPSAEELAHYSNRFKIRGYRKIDSEEDLKGELYKGNPVVFGIKPGPAFDHYRSGIIDSTEAGDTGHAMVMVGYDDEKQAFHFVNSWGTVWGEKGFGWLGYSATRSLWIEGFVMSVDAPPVPPEPPTPQPTPAPPAIVDAPHFDPATPCSHVTWNAVRAGAGFNVKLGGFVGKPENLQSILDSARQKAGVMAVDGSEVQLRPWPQCEALLTLDGALADARGLSVTKSPDKAQLVKGDSFSLEVHSPDYPSYLYVAYLQADGSAKFLLRPAEAGMVPPNTVIRLGEGAKVVHYKVGPPFGSEMIIALASDQPLLGNDTPVYDRALLSAYRRVLLHAQLASAAMVDINTADQ